MFHAGFMRQTGDLFNMLMVSQRWGDAAKLQMDRVQRMVKTQRNTFDICALEQLAQVMHPHGCRGTGSSAWHIDCI